MSRHKLVKALDLDAELDDYDGGEDYEDFEDGYTDRRAHHAFLQSLAKNLQNSAPRIKVVNYLQLNTKLLTKKSEQLQHGAVEVRGVLGPEVGVSDQEIEEALWHYYYDVEKSVNYLLSMYVNLAFNNQF